MRENNGDGRQTAHDLVPVLEEAQQLRPDSEERVQNGDSYCVQRYRPPIEGLFARIERGRTSGPGRCIGRT